MENVFPLLWSRTNSTRREKKNWAVVTTGHGRIWACASPGVGSVLRQSARRLRHSQTAQCAPKGENRKQKKKKKDAAAMHEAWGSMLRGSELSDPSYQSHLILCARLLGHISFCGAQHHGRV